MQCPSCHSVVQGNPPFCPSCGAPLPREAAPDPLLGRMLAGKYRLVQLLGEGGMGAVYVGEQTLGTKTRKVAIKTLHAHLSRDESIRARFQRECETLAGLQHPNTVQIFDFGTSEDGLLYIVMEFVQGRSIAEALEKEGAMSADRVTRIVEQIGGSLAEAHSQGIIHRDLKPDNVVLTERAGQKDFVKVLDFGIAKRSGEADRNEKKLTQQGMVLGTPPYMSPEQFTGQALDARSDIYSLGVMAYEMLTGQLPFDAGSAWEWATMHMTAAPKPIEATPNGARLPESMRAAVMRALAKNPDQRFPTVNELVDRFTGRRGPDAAEVSQRHATNYKGSAAPPPNAPARTAGMDAPMAAYGYDPALAGAPPNPADARPKTQVGEPIVLPPDAFGASPGSPAMSGYAAPAASAFAPPAPGPAAYGPPPAAIPPAHGHHGPQEHGGRSNKGLILGLAGVAALVCIGAIAWGAGLFSGGGPKTDVPPLDLSSSGGATTTTTATTTPPTPDTAPTTAPPVPTTTSAPPLTPGPHVTPPAPPHTAPKPTTPPATPPATPPPAPTPTPKPPPVTPPPPAPTPTPAPPPPAPTPTPPPPPVTPPPAPTEPVVCAQARAARARGQAAVAAALERQCRMAGGTP